jgi:hypothetical protein
MRPDHLTFSSSGTNSAARGRKGVVFLFLLVLALGWVIQPAAAQPSTVRDFEVKAGFLIKFTQYTEWPANTFSGSNAPVIIGVAGGDPLFKQLEMEARNVTGSRPVEVRQIKSPEEAAACHVVFISESENRNESEWFGALKGKAILTVGESEWSIERGAVMRFVIRNKNVRFEASLAAAGESRLALNERMLAVASRVYKRPRNSSP